MRFGSLASAVGAVLAVSLVVPGVAAAHVRIGTLAVDVRVRVFQPARGAPFDVTVDQAGRSLRLTVPKGHRAVVLGYFGEPVLRIDGRGVAVNASSPTAAAAGLLAAHDRSTGWEPLRGGATWRDPRLQRLPTGLERSRWTIPLLVDGRRTRIVGELQRVRRPRAWSWLLVVLALVAGGSLLLLGGQRRLRAGCVALSGAATLAAVVTGAGFAFEPGATGSRIAAVYLVLFAAGGAGFAAWGPPELRVAAAAWLGLVGLMAGLAYGQVFLHGVVLSALPAAATRVADAIAIGTGAAACLLGAVSYARPESAPPQQTRRPARPGSSATTS